MQIIRIVNLRNYKQVEGEILVKVDRSSVLGNPFYMKDESQRNKVCDKYQEYFDNKIRESLPDYSQPYKYTQHNEFMLRIISIANLAKRHNVALGCWCYPKRCHAETILKYIEGVL